MATQVSAISQEVKRLLEKHNTTANGVIAALRKKVGPTGPRIADSTLYMVLSGSTKQPAPYLLALICYALDEPFTRLIPTLDPSRARNPYGEDTLKYQIENAWTSDQMAEKLALHRLEYATLITGGYLPADVLEDVAGILHLDKGLLNAVPDLPQYEGLPEPEAPEPEPPALAPTPDAAPAVEARARFPHPETLELTLVRAMRSLIDPVRPQVGKEAALRLYIFHAADQLVDRGGGPQVALYLDALEVLLDPLELLESNGLTLARAFGALSEASLARGLETEDAHLANALLVALQLRLAQEGETP